MPSKSLPIPTLEEIWLSAFYHNVQNNAGNLLFLPGHLGDMLNVVRNDINGCVPGIGDEYGVEIDLFEIFLDSLLLFLKTQRGIP